MIARLLHSPRSLALATAVGAAAVLAVNLGHSPDTVLDEVLYTRASQHVAQDWQLGWGSDPLFVHPPLYFLLQGGWLRITGAFDDPILAVLLTVRVLSVFFAACNVGLIALFTFELAPQSNVSRRAFLAASAAVLATFDAVLMRYARLGMLESAALFAALLALYAAWKLRERSTVRWVAVVGLFTGMALLTKEVSIVLLLTPLVFAIIRRSRGEVRRSLLGLGVGIAMWFAFAVWALSLGRGGFFLDEKGRSLDRLVGIIQFSGLNRPQVSATDALTQSAGQYATSYALLAGGAGALVFWLWRRRVQEAEGFLFAWLACCYVFGAYTVLVGQFNEQFFVYLMPGAVVGTVLMGDWATRVSALRRDGSAAGRHRVVPAAVVLALGIVMVAGVANWARIYAFGHDDATRQMVAAIERITPPGAAINASGAPETYLYTVPGRAITDFSSGPVAQQRGVRYFLLNTKDVDRRYGSMTPALADWIRSSGQRLVQLPSRSYWSSELWYVPANTTDSGTEARLAPADLPQVVQRSQDVRLFVLLFAFTLIAWAAVSKLAIRRERAQSQAPAETDLLQRNSP